MDPILSVMRLVIPVLWLVLGGSLWTEFTVRSATWYLEGWPSLLFRAVIYVFATKWLIDSSILLWCSDSPEKAEKAKSPWSY